MRRKIYLTLMLALFAGYALKAQVEVPVSMHETDQLVQGPCYIFAALAALESKAIANQTNCVDPNYIDFNEWLFYSDQVIGGNWSDKPMIEYTLLHMATQGARHRGTQFEPSTRSDLPNMHLSETISSQLTGQAKFTGQVCDNWVNNYGFYKKNVDGGCSDGDTPAVKFLTSSLANDGLPTYKLRNASGNSVSSIANLPLVRQLISLQNNTTRANMIENILQNGHGVIAVFEDWKTPPGIPLGAEHAIFIYKKHGNLYWYKDSWPTFYGGPTFIKPNEQGQGLPLSKLRKLYYIDGIVETSQPLQTVACDYEIVEKSNDGNIAVYGLGGGTCVLSNYSWSVTGTLSIIGPTNENEVTVQLNGACGLFDPAVYVNVSYNNENQNCSDSHLTNRLLQAPPAITMIGPPGGISSLCAGEFVELQADQGTNPPYPQTSYEWQVSGANIIAGQGTPTLHIEITGTLGSYKLFKVRAHDAICNKTSIWTSISGYSASSCGGGGLGGPGGGFIGPNARNMDFTDFFEDTPKAKTVQIEIYSMEGRRLLKGEVNANDPIQSLKLVPKGIAIIRLYSPETGEFRSFKQLLKE